MSTPRIANVLLASSLGTLALVAATPASAEDPYTISANIGVASNYIWRGVSQTQDGPAVQGGLDFTHNSGFYAGLWGSNVDFNDEGASQDVVILADPTTASGFAEDADGNLIGTTSGSSNSSSATYEIDAYLGYAGKINEDLGYNLKAIYYAYPDGRDLGFAEIDTSMSFKWLTAGIAYTVFAEAEDGGIPDEGDFYYYAGFKFDLPYEMALAGRGGYYTYTNSNGNSYGNWGLTLSKAAGDFGTFSLNYDQTGGNGSGLDADPKLWVAWNKSF